MTLDTRIYVKSQCDQREVFDKVNEILHIQNASYVVCEDSAPYGCVEEGSIERSNNPLQGFCGWVMTYHNPDGLRYSEEYKAECAEDHKNYHTGPDAEDCDCDNRNERGDGSVIMEISVDTGYGFRGGEDWNRGWSCTLLHTYLLVELGAWFKSKGIEWAWENEFTGEIHHELTQENLTEFNGSGLEAFEWFHNAVVPAIKSEHPDVEWM